METKKLSLQELQSIETKMLHKVVAICQRHNLRYYLVYGSALGAVRHGGPIPWDYDVDIAIPYPDLQRFNAVMRKELPKEYYLNFHDNDPYYPELFPRIGLRNYSTKTLHLDVFLLIGAPTAPQAQKAFKNKAKMYWFFFKFGNFNPTYFGKFTRLKQKIFVPIVRTLLAPFSKQWVLKQFDQLCNQYPYNAAQTIVNAQFGYSMQEFIPKAYYQEGSEFDYAGATVRIPKAHHEYLRHIYGDYLTIPEEKDRITPDFYLISSRETDQF